MKNNLKNSNNFFSDRKGDVNFFSSNSYFEEESYNSPVKRLNDYDYNILQEEAYKDVSDELFKLEYKISHIEEDLKENEIQIQSARDISDYDRVEFLLNRKKNLSEDLKNLMDIYNDKSLSSKISGGFFNIISPCIKNLFLKLNEFILSFKEFIISKLPYKFSSVLELKQSLDKLESISKNVDELMTMQTPYGEADDKYLQLSKYIVRANNIQSQISKSLK